MTRAQRPRRLEENVLVQPVGAETLLYDEVRHMGFCLNESSSAVWRLADGTRSVAQIADEASETLGARVYEEAVLLALNELSGMGLLAAAEAAGSNLIACGGAGLSRRTLVQGMGTAGALLLPGIAFIMAPTAAQAYSGCFDCSSAPAIQGAQAARARRRQQAADEAAPSGPPSQ